MSENEMGYRGSKSVNNIFTVKEQRVDGSYFDKKSRLRCTLTGYENSYPIKNPSKQKYRHYSTSSWSEHLKQSAHKNLNPWFITGFSDAEGCFTILIQPNNKYRLNWRVKPIFTIGLHNKDLALLNKIKYYLGAGSVINYTSTSKAVFSVESFQDLDIIINHFDKYPLVSAKKNDYLIFKQCFELIREGEHLNEKGLLKIISLKHSLNLGLPENLIEAFKDKIDNITKMKKSPFVFTGIPDPYWLSGFTSGDGSFNLKLGKSNFTSIGFRVQLRFGIGLHIRELELIKGIASYLNLLVPISNLTDKYKYIEVRSSRNGPSVLFQITKF